MRGSTMSGGERSTTWGKTGRTAGLELPGKLVAVAFRVFRGWVPSLSS